MREVSAYFAHIFYRNYASREEKGGPNYRSDTSKSLKISHGYLFQTALVNIGPCTSFCDQQNDQVDPKRQCVTIIAVVGSAKKKTRVTNSIVA